MRLWRKGNHSTLLVGMQTGAAAVGNSMEFPKKTKNGMPFDTAILLLGLYPEILKHQFKRTYAPISIAALITIAK